MNKKCIVCKVKLPKEKIGNKVCSNRCAASIGGRKKNPFKGYGTNRDLAVIHGRKGGKISRRGKNVLEN